MDREKEKIGIVIVASTVLRVLVVRVNEGRKLSLTFILALRRPFLVAIAGGRPGRTAAVTSLVVTASH